MIPKIIWQTYKDSFDNLPQYAKDTIQTWKDLNPDYKYMYMNDDECRSFISHEYGQEWLDIFDKCPVGVMRGDIWRYLIIYSYGGIYCDIDTICLKPIKEWVDDKYSAVICQDDDPSTYNQLTFAARPNHIILKYTLDYVKNKLNNPNYDDKNFVDNLTGVFAWTNAINLIDSNLLKDIFVYPESQNLYLQNNEAIYFNGSIKHLTASKNWNDGKYVQWQKEVIK